MLVSEKERVLLVDDEPQILVALEDLLSQRFVILKAGSGEEALRLLERENNIAVVVSDQRMPRMTGDELVAKVNASYDTQRILVTGYADLGAVVRAVNDGRIYAYVTKPWDEEDLMLKVAHAATQFRLEQQLASEKQLLDDLLNHSPDGIYFKDMSLRFVRANRTLAEWYGKDVDELVGARWADILHSKEEALEIERAERSALEHRRPILAKVRQESGPSAARWFSDTKAPILGWHHEPTGLVGITRDVTRDRELEQALLQSQKMEAVGRLAGGVAHDFNNLLVVISSYGELIRESLEQDDSRRGEMDELLKASDRAAALTRQLLTFSRRRPTKMTLLDINEVVSEVATMLKRLLTQNVRIELNLAPYVDMVRGDTTQLEQVILNLVINARDAMSEGGDLRILTRRVERGAPRPGTFVCLTVEDTGMGMSPEIKERIFEPFFTTKEAAKGTGLGLSTVYGIVHQFGGEINVESELGKGTRFDIFLPINNDRPTPVQAAQAARVSRASQGTVLLVEDDEAVRRVAASILARDGYDVLEAAGAAEAREIARRRDVSIDLLLTDIVMPETNGIALSEELSALLPAMRVLYMSGYVEEDSRAEEFMDDSCSFVEKPFNPDKLLAAVRGALDPSDADLDVDLRARSE